MFPDNTEYAYYLKNFESNWNYTTNNSSTYTNLFPGKYYFRLKARNGGDWSEVRELVIVVSPPFWLSTWGYITYLIIAITLIIIFVKYLETRNREKYKLQMANMDREKDEYIHQQKLDFFTYISHEFKTPLSIVIASIEELINKNDNNSEDAEYKGLIKKNAFRLLSLINQLMDFRKIETKHSSIKLNKGEIIGFIGSILDSFKPLFNKKAIKTSIDSNLENYNTFFDVDKLEMIISNLLSNAYKALNKHGYIKILIEIKETENTHSDYNKLMSDSEIIIQIIDNGPGIENDKLAKLLKPFYTGNTKSNYNSGIGLALTNELVKILHGNISVSSKLGQGTEFVISLPLFENPLTEYIKNKNFVKTSNSEILEGIILSLDDDLNLNKTNDTVKLESNKKMYNVLIVEDNNELAIFLKNHFSKKYKTSLVRNGKDALIKIKNSHPDIIISDIMMPIMDGYEMCNILKGDVETSHIPIVLLTAKSGVDSKIEGLLNGADAYLSKPFNLKVLDLQVNNILSAIDSNKKLSTKFEAIDDSTNQLHNKDAQFIGKLTDIILEHLENPEFKVNELCNKALISRTHLHLKLKELTGLTTSGFIRTVRLNEAKKLLTTKMYTVSEVANMVGYNDSVYFSKSFKKVFNKLPSELLKS
jgi:signal transduction histidine kinase/DNA-binding response OmpR family regulator